jgi:hypothetical protein
VDRKQLAEAIDRGAVTLLANIPDDSDVVIVVRNPQTADVHVWIPARMAASESGTDIATRQRVEQLLHNGIDAARYETPRVVSDR